jgi:HAD superfamily hydrolase (TIGR01509 family)
MNEVTSDPAPPFAAVFDWDGVIINSEECHRRGWEVLAAELGLEYPPGYFEKTFGRKNAEIIPDFLGWTKDPALIAEYSFRKEACYRQVVQERGVQALPGVRVWLQRLEDAGVPCGIGSSTARANIDLSLEMIGCAQFFRTIVSAEDVKIGKPDPAVFLTVAERLGMPAERCIVFEDAFVGLEAAQRAGMKRVAVATTNPAEALREHADRVVTRMDELTVEECAQWWAASA